MIISFCSGEGGVHSEITFLSNGNLLEVGKRQKGVGEFAFCKHSLKKKIESVIVLFLHERWFLCTQEYKCRGKFHQFNVLPSQVCGHGWHSW